MSAFIIAVRELLRRYVVGSIDSAQLIEGIEDRIRELKKTGLPRRGE